jgi:pyruvate dehydrogenase E1 component alpha subunit
MARKATATKAKTQANVPQFTHEQDLEAFREMLLIRRFE